METAITSSINDWKPHHADDFPNELESRCATAGPSVRRAACDAGGDRRQSTLQTVTTHYIVQSGLCERSNDKNLLTIVKAPRGLWRLFT